MSPSSPLTDEAPLSFKITAAGQAIDDTYQVISVDTWNTVNKVPRARIVLSDGDMPQGTFPVSDAATFLPGTAIELSVGYGDNRDVHLLRHRDQAQHRNSRRERVHAGGRAGGLGDQDDRRAPHGLSRRR